MTDFSCEAVVIGAGVVGLAVARALSLAGFEVIILERQNRIGSGNSSRNSEVIHAGIYYPKDSLKARFCVQGKERLYDYCRSRHIRHKNCGKVIVAVHDEQVPKLQEIEAKAKANGVNDLRTLSREEINAMEPEVKAVGGLFSPSTGIIDSHHYMETLLGDVQNAGGSIVYNAPVEKGEITEKGLFLDVGGAEPCRIRAKCVVNSAGLDTTRVMKSLKGFPQEHVPQQFFAKGNYFVLTTKSPFKHLVYPIPEAAGLGVHATLDLAGQCRFGPDVEWVENDSNYQVNPARGPSFYEAIRRYWPGLKDGSLAPGYSGIRPKLQTPNGPAADFIIQSEKIHKIQGLVNLLGIESPGLTSSLAIAEAVKGLLLS